MTEPQLENQLTREEDLAIGTLHRLEKRWPKSLWLFSANGQLCVMKKDQGGKRVMDKEGVDSAWVVATVSIENDGGDW